MERDGQSEGEGPKKTFKEKLRQDWLPSWQSSLKNIQRALRLVWTADPQTSVWLALLTLTSGLLPVGQAWVGKLIVDSVVHSVRQGLGFRDGIQAAIPYLAAEFFLIFVSSAISQFRAFYGEVMDHKLGHSINSQIVKKALDLDLR